MTLEDRTSRQASVSNQSAPHEVSYFGAPAGQVFATDAAIAALARARRWATVAAAVLFLGGGLGLLLGAYVVMLIVFNPAARGSANAVLGGGGVYYGALAVVAGVLLVRFILAVNSTHKLRRSEDLERAMVALRWFIAWMTLCLLAAMMYPFIVMFVAAWVGAWP